MPSFQKEARAGTCIFCEIVAGRALASRVAENSLSIAFLTIGPLREGHSLVIPKRHAVEFTDPTRALPSTRKALQPVAERLGCAAKSHAPD